MNENMIDNLVNPMVDNIRQILVVLDSMKATEEEKKAFLNKIKDSVEELIRENS